MRPADALQKLLSTRAEGCYSRAVKQKRNRAYDRKVSSCELTRSDKCPLASWLDLGLTLFFNQTPRLPPSTTHPISSVSLFAQTRLASAIRETHARSGGFCFLYSLFLMVAPRGTSRLLSSYWLQRSHVARQFLAIFFFEHLPFCTFFAHFLSRYLPFLSLQLPLPANRLGELWAVGTFELGQR